MKIHTLENMGSKGFAALPVVLLVGAIVIELIVSLSLMTYAMLQSSFGAAQSSEAMMIAQSGIDDAMIKILKDNAYTTDSVSPYYYTLQSGANRQAQVTVCQNTKLDSSGRCVEINNGQIEITSTGKSAMKRRKLKAYIPIDQSGGRIFMVSLEEVPL